jgi:hypothetical protein
MFGTIGFGFSASGSGGGGGGLTSISANSGLRTTSVSNVQFGSPTIGASPLLQNTYLNLDGFNFTINGGATATYNLLIEDTGVNKSEITIDSSSFNLQTTTNATNVVSGLDLTSSFGGAGSIRRTDTTTGFYTGLYYLGSEVGWNVTDNITQYEYHFPPPPYVVNSVLADVSGSGFLTWLPVSSIVSPTITADNGLTKTGNNIQLGGTLLNTTTINGGIYTLSLSSSTTFPNNALSVTNSGTGAAILGTATGSATAVGGIAASGIGVSGGTTNGTGIKAYSSGGVGIPLSVSNSNASTNTILTMITLQRESSGVVANGIGQQILFNTETDVNIWSSNTIISKWSDATESTRTSQFEIRGVNSAVESTIFTLKGTGQLQLNKYVSSAFLGTATEQLGVDASGNVITIALPTPSPTLTFDSGLTRTLDNVQLGSTTTTGSPLLHKTYLNLDGFDFWINGGATATYNLLIDDIGVSNTESFIDNSAYYTQSTNVATNVISGIDITSSFGGAGSLRKTDAVTGLYNGFFFLGNQLGWNVTDGITQYDYYLPPAGTGYPAANSVLADISGTGFLTWATIGSIGSGFVPYTGATGGVNLGLYDLIVNNLTIGKGLAPLSNNTAIGYQTLFHTTTGNFNTALGYQAAHNLTTGQYNTAIGQSALFTATTGGLNTAIGLNALLNTTSGSSNVAVGLDTLQHITTGASNTGVGYNAGSHITDGITPNTTAQNGVFIGRDSKAKVNGGSNEIVIGQNAIGNGSNTATIGNSSITANYFTGSVNGGSFVKYGGLSTEFLKADGSVDSSSYITSVSMQSAYNGGNTINGITFTIDYVTNFRLNIGTGNITSGVNVIAIGIGAANLSSGDNIVAIGNTAASQNTGTSGIIAIGNTAAQLNSGQDVIGIGQGASLQNTGNVVVGLGSTAAQFNSGDSVVGVGNNAAGFNTGDFIVGIGSQALNQNSGDYSVGIGYFSAKGNQQQYAIGIGFQSLLNNFGLNSIGIGYNAGNSNVGNYVVAIGGNAANNNSGANTTALGYDSLGQNTGQSATSVGIGAGYLNTGDYLSSLGDNAGKGNLGNYVIGIGYRGAKDNLANNVIGIGYRAAEFNAVGCDNVIALGDNAARFNVSGSGLIAIGKNAGDSQFGAGNIYLGNDIDNGSVALTTWGNRIGIGTNAIVTNDNAIAIGYVAQAHAINSISIGASAGNGNTSTGEFIAIGRDAAALGGTGGSIAIGSQALYLAATKQSVAIGSQTGYISNGQDNVFIGNTAGYENQGGSAVMLGLIAGAYNLGSDVTAIGQNAGIYNNGSYVVAIGVNAGGQVGVNAFVNDNLVAIGSDAGYTNQAADLIAIGSSSGQGNQGANSVVIGAGGAGAANIGDYLVAVGSSAGNSNEGIYVNGIGVKAAQGNLGNKVVAIGFEAAVSNQANNVIALGTSVGTVNILNNVFIVSNSELPSFATNVLAAATLGFGSSGSTYLYYNSTTFAIEGVRIP